MEAGPLSAPTASPAHPLFAAIPRKHDIMRSRQGRDMSKKHFADIKKYANVIENLLDDEGCTTERVLTATAGCL